MSDEEDFIMEEDDDDEFDFEYDDINEAYDDDDEIKDDASSSSRGEARGGASLKGAQNVENAYYLAKEKRDTDLCGALKDFESIAETDGVSALWKFKALKQVVKASLALSDESLFSNYKKLLEMLKSSSVPKAHGEKSLGNLIERVSKCGSDELTSRFYRQTLEEINSESHEKLWIRLMLKLAELLLLQEKHDQLNEVLCALETRLHAPVLSHSASDQSRNAVLLQVYALRIQEAMARNDLVQMRQTFASTRNIATALVHPRITGVINECGGKIFAADKNWDKAQTAFFEAFKNYDEAGSPRRIACLQYLVFLSMIGNSAINPFDSQETKPYATHHELKPLGELSVAYQSNNLASVQSMLESPVIQQSGGKDLFYRNCMETLVNSLRTRMVIATLQYYTNVEVSFVAEQISVTADECESLLAQLILSGKLRGKIDQITKRFELDSQSCLNSVDLAQQKWISATDRLLSAIASQIQI